MKNQPDYYAILGISPDATSEEVREAAKALGARFPKDARDPSQNVAYRQLLEAYEVLRDPERRAAYDAARQARTGFLDLTVQASRESIGALDNDQLLYLLVDIRPPHKAAERRRSINLSLVFDCSTSMGGKRLERVKIAAAQVIERLSPEDVVSVIGFSDRAQTIVPAARVNNKQLLISRIDRMKASGGTEIFQGLKAGVKEMRKAMMSRYVNHLVLLTDGHTYGDEEQCIKLADEISKQSVTITAFGIGGDWNDKFLDELVTASGGRSIFIEEPDQIIDYLQERIQGLGTVYAQDVRLLANFPASISCSEVMKLSPFAQPLDCGGKEIALGVVEGRAPLSALLELKIKPQPAGRRLEIPLDFRADIPVEQLQDYPFDARHTVKVVPGDPDLSPSPSIVRAVQMLNLHRMNERAWSEAEAGQLDMATKRMERLTSRLMAAGHTKLAQQAMMETQRLSRMGTASSEGRKKMKYGTRSLISKTVRFDKEDD
ncbi:MAG: VWA domain-containing protein [Candidatus Promineifilaceae bacterium]|nr:VWA domain-containing protein [Candidatus Promineifilaceae bacterium]